MYRYFFPLLLAAPVVMAGDSVELAPVPEPPDIMEAMEKSETTEPQVTITQDDVVIEEYKRNGELYMVKITPAVGPPYYLIDTDGDGRMESRRSDLDDVSVPHWVLFTW